jgi:hypothetical protein
MQLLGHFLFIPYIVTKSVWVIYLNLGVIKTGGPMCARINSMLLASVIVTVLLTLVIAAQGQPHSDNYILKKWAISSGGGSASSDNYQAVMIVGQSSPPGVSTSENYTLYSGYLQPIFAGGAPGAPLVWVWTDSVNVYLDWDDVPNATSYKIYRGSAPDVMVDPGNLIGTSATSEYTDADAAADSVKFFYLITADN